MVLCNCGISNYIVPVKEYRNIDYISDYNRDNEHPDEFPSYVVFFDLLNNETDVIEDIKNYIKSTDLSLRGRVILWE